MLLQGVLGNTLHAKDFDFESLAVRKRIFDLAEGFFVDLVQVYGETCSRLMFSKPVSRLRCRLRLHVPNEERLSYLRLC